MATGRGWQITCRVVAAVALFAGVLTFWYVIPRNSTNSAVCRMEIFGVLDEAMLAHVRKSVRLAHEASCMDLRAEIFSPGGSVATSVEISQELFRARMRGLVVRTVGRSFVASGATIVLSAGSPGMREIAHNSLVLVHGIQVPKSFWSQECKDYLPDATTEDEKMLNQAILMVAREYAINTGKSIRETLKWLGCSNSRVGDGTLALKLGLADKISTD